MRDIGCSAVGLAGRDIAVAAAAAAAAVVVVVVVVVVVAGGGAAAAAVYAAVRGLGDVVVSAERKERGSNSFVQSTFLVVTLISD